MNLQRIIGTALICVVLASRGFAQEMDKELSDLATKLGTLIKDNGKKKVTVLDFTDLQGGGSELGKYIAEELTVNLVMVKSNFAVLDRANLKKILAEHKLTATGLVDPENAKKLGQFAGVDALILGTIIPKNQKINLTAKIITTDTAEIVGAAKAEFKSDETVEKLLAQPASEAPADDRALITNESTTIAKSFGDLRLQLQSLRIVDSNDAKEYLLTMTFTNQNLKKPIWISMSNQGNNPAAPSPSLYDPEGYEFPGTVAGLAVGGWGSWTGYDGDVTTIRPKESTTATLKFRSRPGRQAASGSCRIQFTILTLSVDGYGKVIGYKPSNVSTEMKTN